ncbi:MAG: homoserine kinase [Methylococcales bacterium]|nr:homoserine kinase [Methylococcales bacterium]
MSVYTTINQLQLAQFLRAYDLGQALSFEGIQAGINNSNYFVETTQGSFVLTLFETLDADDLTHFIKLLPHLAGQGIPCPSPQADRQGQCLHQLNGKPAALFNRLSGHTVNRPTSSQCHAIGACLARVHKATQNYPFPISNSHDLDGCKSQLDKMAASLPTPDLALISDELRFQTENTHPSLPQGLIHADLFRDNALFVGEQLSGILDFYSACQGVLLSDIAIVANDWCCENGQMNADKMAAMLAGYESVRPLSAAEKQHWNVALRAAALRFWLSRLEHQLFPRPGDLIQQKDPLYFKHLLLEHRAKVG